MSLHCSWLEVVHHPAVYAMVRPIEPLLPNNSGYNYPQPDRKHFRWHTRNPSALASEEGWCEFARAFRPNPPSIGAGPDFQAQPPEHHEHQLALARAFKPDPPSIMSISLRWPGLSGQTHEHHEHELARAFRPKPGAGPDFQAQTPSAS